MGILLCEQNFRDVWRRNKSVRAEIGQILRTHTRGSISSRDRRSVNTPAARTDEGTPYATPYVRPYQHVVAGWPMGQNLFLMSHPDVSLVNILLSITRVSLVQNKCVFCQLRVHVIGDPGITKTYLGIQHANILQYLHELNGNVHYINIYNVPTLNCAACKLQRVNRDERRQLYNCAAYRLQRFNRDEHSAVREQWIRPIPMLSV